VRAALKEQTSPTGPRPARDWLQALAQHFECRCFPAVDWVTGRVFWPDDFDLAALKHVKREYNDEAAGQILAVELFAPKPEQARCILSLGQRPARPANDLVEILEPPANATALMRKLLYEPVIQLARSLPARPSAMQREQVVLGILDRLGNSVEELTQEGEADVLLLDQFLEALRGWLREHELELLPRCCSFFDLPMFDALKDEAPNPEVNFSEAPCGKVIQVRSFGLARTGGTAIRSARVCLSAGPVPAHYAELQGLLARQESPCELALAGCLVRLPAAEVEHPRQPVNIEDLFDAFWEHQDAWSRQDDSRDQQFKMHLQALLREEYHLILFEPQTIFEKEPTEHWLEIQGEVRNGNVVRVLRAGLITEQQTPLRKAHVEVD
jgi:hypothetical protein